MKKILLLIVFAAAMTSVFGAVGPKYWVGRGADTNWSTVANWASTSGGSDVVTAPATGDDVYFDSNSGANVTVYCTGALATLNSLNMTSCNITFGIVPAATQAITANLSTASAAYTLSATNASIAANQFVYVYTGDGKIAYGTTVKTISGTTLTLSGNATGNSTSAPTLAFVNTTATSITTKTVSLNNSAVISNFTITVNGGVGNGSSTYDFSMLGISTWTQAPFASGQSITLGNGTNTFYLNGNSATNYFDGSNKAYITVNTPSPITLWFSQSSISGNNGNGGGALTAPAVNCWAGIAATKGITTIANNFNTARIMFGSGGSTQGIVLNSGVTLNITSNGSCTFNANANCQGIDASASGSKVIVTSTDASFITTASGNTIFKKTTPTATTINYLELNRNGYVFTLPQAITVNNLVLTNGQINNTTNNVTVINGGTITRSNQAASLTSPPIYGTLSTDRANVTIGASCNAGNELLGTTAGKVGTLTVNSGSTYTLSSTFVTGYSTLVGGTGYGSSPSVTFSAPSTTGGVTATASVVAASGVFTSISITNPGSGYTSAPTITFNSGGTGVSSPSGASATALISTNSSLYADALNIAGTLNFANTASLPVTLNVGGDVTVSGSISASTLSNAVNHVLNVGGNISNSGTINLLNAATTKAIDLTLNGTSSNQSLGAATLNSLTVNNTASSNAGVTLGNAVTVSNVLNLSSGTLSVGANTLTLAGTAPTRTSGVIDATNASSVVAFTNGTSMTLPAGLFPSAIKTLTINGAGGVILGEGITISKALNLTAGALTNSASNNITFNGGLTPVEITRLAGSISGTGATYPVFTSQANVTYTNSSTISTGFEIAFDNTKTNNVTLTNGNINMGAARTINGNLSLQSGVLSLGSLILTYKGSSITRTSGTIDASGASAGITFSNTSSLTLPTGLFSANLNTLTVNGSGGSVILPDALTVNGLTTVGVGSTLAIGGTLTTTGGSTINGTLQINAGSISASPTYGSSSTLIYNTGGTYGRYKELDTTTPANLQISGNTTLNYPNGAVVARTFTGNLTIDAGSALYMDYSISGVNQPLSVNGNITLNGNLSLGNALGGDLYLSGNWSRGISSNFYPNSRAVIFNGTGNQSISNTSGETFAYLTVNNSAGGVLSLNDNVTVGNDLIVNPGSALTLSSSKSLAVTGNFTISSNSSKTGTFVNANSTGGLTVTGTTNVEQYLTTGRNWYVSSPVTTALSSVFGAVAPSTNKLYWYDETNGSSPSLSWPQITDNTSSLAVMRGYIANMPTDGKVTFTGGTLNNGNITTGANGVPALTRTAGQAKEGFNLVGNPYPSYLDWMAAIDVANTGTSNLMTTMWYRTQNPGTYVTPNVTPYYVFDTFNETANTGTNNNGNGAVTQFIPPMQAFWVRVTSGQTSGTLALTNAMRHHESGTNRLKVKSTKNSAQQVLRLQVSNGTNTDEAILLFNANASNGFDNYDSPKMSNGNAAIPEIYTMAGSEILTINGLNSIPVNTELPLGFTTGQTNTFSIKATEISNFDSGTEIVLKDNVKNVEQTISNGTTYSFTSDAINTTSRFSIIFRTASVTTGVDNNANEKSGINVFKNADNQIAINCNNGVMKQGTISVYNALGQKLINAVTTGTSTVINRTFSPGVYTIIVNLAGNKETRKLILN